MSERSKDELLESHGIKVIGKGFNGQDAVFLFQKIEARCYLS